MKKFAISASVAAVAMGGLAFAAIGGFDRVASGVSNGWLVQIPASNANNTAIAPAAAPAANIASLNSGDVVPGSYICTFRAGSLGNGLTPATLGQRIRDEVARSVNMAGGTSDRTYSSAIQGFAIKASEQAITRMRGANPNIEQCQQDRVVKIDLPANAISVSGANTGGTSSTTPLPQTIPVGITRVGGGSARSRATAWILDSGIDFDHPDLNVDVARSRDFNTVQPNLEDNNGHGTLIAGIIGARNNSFGVVGVVPGARVASVRAFDNRLVGINSDILAGIDYISANARPGDVVNMSFGAPFGDYALTTATEALGKKGIKVAISSGNDSRNIILVAPANADGPNIYTVSAIDSNDVFASFSNFGRFVDYAQPGVAIFSTFLDGRYATASGTSFAAPHMAGLLMAGWTSRTRGFAINDPDGFPDKIAVLR